MWQWVLVIQRQGCLHGPRDYMLEAHTVLVAKAERIIVSITKKRKRKKEKKKKASLNFVSNNVLAITVIFQQ